jgi:sulfatase modifying factor 1
VRLLQLYPPESVPLLTAALSRHSQSAAELQNVAPPGIIKRRSANVLQPAEERAYVAYTNVLLAGACLGSEGRLWPSLTRTSDRTLRSMLMVHAASAGISPEALAMHLVKEKDPARRQAIVLMLSGYPMSALAAASQDRVVKWLRDSYLSDTDGGVHSAIATLMKRWSLSDDLAALQKTLPKSPSPLPGVSWWVTPSGVDMRVIKMPDGRRFAIGSGEVTFEEFRRFEKKHPYWPANTDSRKPISGINWYSAARYCDWLSRQENIDSSQLCYLEDGANMRQHPSATEHLGYRLPLSSEWQFASSGVSWCRWDFGNAPSLAPHFAWCSNNTAGAPSLVGGLLPNLNGLWDAHGNVREWCHDWEWAEGPSTSMGLAVGGAFDSAATEFASLQRRPTNLSSPRPEIGFRLVRSLPSEKK